MPKKPILCIMYDFDKTLCTQDMQNFGTIPDLGLTPAEFWGKTGEFSDKYGVERILSYMYVMIEEATKRGIKFTKDYLKSTAKNIVYYKGVDTWFNRINQYGKEHGFIVEHYVISSGLYEIISGSSIFKEFKKVYACEYFYGSDDIAIWPKLVINYTQKTQFVFRISKGVTNISDDNSVNSKMSKDNRRVLYHNMIYIGDGITDIPCMQLVKDKGGVSIAVYKSKDKENAKILSQDERVNFSCRADYSENSSLENIVKTIIDSKEARYKLEQIEKKERKAMKGDK